MEQIKEAFRDVMLRDLRPIEDRDGVRVGDNVRIHEKGGTFVVRFLKGTKEKDRQQIRDRLETNDLEYEEGQDFTL